MKLPLRASHTLWVDGLLIGVLLTLRVLAYADPPDPSWIAGLWDDADYDDVVILVTSAVGIVDSDPFVDAQPTTIIIGSLRTDHDHRLPTGASSPHDPRAPPASSVSS